MTRRERTITVLVSALRAGGDVGKAMLLDRAEYRWITDRTVSVEGVRYTDADCGCVLAWRTNGGKPPAFGRVLHDCGGAHGHLPHEAIVGAEVLEESRP